MNIERAVIEINGGCNYSCQMCPQSNPGRHKDFLKKMSLSHFEDMVAQCAEQGLKVVNLEGSGEPTLNRDLARYVEIVKKYNAKAFIFTNGRLLKDSFMKEVIDAGLDYCRFSIIGYDATTYHEWMNSLAFNQVIKNLNDINQYVLTSNSECVVSTYHLILDQANIPYEVEKYLDIVNTMNVKTEIWKMHNWSGVYKPDYERDGKIKTCGRPFSPDIVIRAGGLNGDYGAVHPCCQVLGQDEKAVLGHTSSTSIKDIWYGEAYEDLRNRHRTGDYPDYCKSCDFLIDDTEVLVYTNHDRDLYKMHGTTFDLNDYRQ
jgi:MoaA/NifB/PqqE/SkfB family radical SAM enzyme